MIRNYLKIAWRNLKNNKFFTFINIIGLAIGLACCMLITLYLYREFTFDQHHKKADRIYQVGTVFMGGEKNDRAPATPSPLGPAMQTEYPEIEKVTRTLALFVDDKTLLQHTDAAQQVRSFYETKGYMADSTYFQLFDYDFKEGIAATCLNEPNSLVLTEEIAEKFFPKQSALGKVIHINSTTNGSYDYKVTGVIRKPAKPTIQEARFIISLSSGDFGNYVRRTTSFSFNNMFTTFLLLKEGTNAKQLEQKFPAFVNEYMAADLKSAGFSKQQFLVALKDIHLRSTFGRQFSTSSGAYGNLNYLYILGSIALFILIIACINFMNLATARSAKRAAEVGIRKVLGAEKNSLVRQFLGESMLLAFISFLIALGLMMLLIPVFSKISGVELSFEISQHYLLLIGFVLLTFIAGMLAGSYPAFYLSAFRPIKVLKGKFSNSLAAVNLRKVLVVFQFTISAGLIICAMVIGKQMNYMRSTDMGFTAEQQIVVPLRSSNAKNIYTSLKNELSRNPQIKSVGASFYYPGIFNPSDQNFYASGKTVNDGVNLKTNWVDDNFLQTLDIKTLAGRTFSKEFPGDTAYRLVINEAASKKLGFKDAQSAVGQQISFDWRDSVYRFTIIGVVHDFNFESLQKPINPYGFQLNNQNSFNYVIAHANNSGNMREVIASIESSWNRLNPTEPFEYSFVDQDFQKNYESENRLAGLIQYFMYIAIAICCLGLFGLAAFSAEQRTKEIGIRKVLGSSVPNIMGLLSKDFVKLVMIGNIVAIPIAWYFMNKWLGGFAFKTSLDWWLFALAMMLSLVISLLTVSYQAIKSALSNPVKSLRSE